MTTSITNMTEAQRERKRETDRLHRERNREHYKELLHDYYNRNKEVVKARSQKWREDNRERYLEARREYYRRTKAKKLAAQETAKPRGEGVDAKGVA